MEEEPLKQGIHILKRIGTFYIFGEYRHTERAQTALVPYYALSAPFTTYVNSRERFELGLDYPGCHKLPFTEENLQPGIYRDVEGRDYNVHGEFIHAYTGELFVCYWAMFEPYASLATPKCKFLEEIAQPELNYKGPRFVLKHAR